MTDLRADMELLADGLQFPEGPVALPSGGVAVVEVAAGTIVAIDDNGERRVVAEPGDGPNGLAWGPGQVLYVCNNGGLGWIRDGDRLDTHGTAPDYETGRIETVDIRTAEVKRLYTRCDPYQLRGPNDLMFAPAGSPSDGGFWFTDYGKKRERDQDYGGVYWAASDGTRIVEAAYPVRGGANGIGLSPDGTTLYVAETETGRLWAWEVVGPGELVKADWPAAHGGRLVCQLGGGRLLDSLAITAAGNVVVGTLISGELTTITPGGEVLDVVEFPDPMPTNVCFGGPDMTTAHVTLSMTGRVVRMRWPEPGLALAFQPTFGAESSGATAGSSAIHHTVPDERTPTGA